MGNYFKALQETPKATLNRHLWYNVVCFALLGAARGVDEGLIGSTASLKSFSGQFGLTDPRLSERAKADKLSNITSMVQLTSIGGARELIFYYFLGIQSLAVSEQKLTCCTCSYRFRDQ